MLDELIAHDRAETVILIPGGIGEKRGSGAEFDSALVTSSTMRARSNVTGIDGPAGRVFLRPRKRGGEPAESRFFPILKRPPFPRGGQPRI